MTPRIPTVEISDHRDAACVRRPHREAHAAHPIDRQHIGAECFGEFEMPPLAEQMKIEIAQYDAERIRVLGFLHRVRPRDAQEIGGVIAHDPLKQAGWLAFLEPADHGAALTAQYLDCSRTGQEGANDQTALGVMRAEYA